MREEHTPLRHMAREMEESTLHEYRLHTLRCHTYGHEMLVTGRCYTEDRRRRHDKRHTQAAYKPGI